MRGPNDQLLVLASDGLWDVFNSQDVCRCGQGRGRAAGTGAKRWVRLESVLAMRVFLFAARGVPGVRVEFVG